jgi:hypothetical protein
VQRKAMLRTLHQINLTHCSKRLQQFFGKYLGEGMSQKKRRGASRAFSFVRVATGNVREE